MLQSSMLQDRDHRVLKHARMQANVAPRRPVASAGASMTVRLPPHYYGDSTGGWWQPEEDSLAPKRSASRTSSPPCTATPTSFGARECVLRLCQARWRNSTLTRLQDHHHRHNRQCKIARAASRRASRLLQHAPKLRSDGTLRLFNSPSGPCLDGRAHMTTGFLARWPGQQPCSDPCYPISLGW